MANSRKNSKYYIINEDVLKSGLRGNELLVYALVRSYVTAGITFDLTVAKIMEMTNIGRRQTIDILQRLVAKCFLVKVGQEREGVTPCAYELGGAETALVEVRKPHHTGAETARDKCGNRTGRGAETARVYNKVCITDSNTFYNTDNNSLSMREGEEVKKQKMGDGMTFQAGSIQEKERREMAVRVGIMEGWQKHYRDVYGTEYLLTRGSITQEVSDLLPAIEQRMEHLGMELSQECVREYCYVLFTELLATADNWQQQRWSIKLITRQFNELLKQRNQGNPSSTANHHQRPTSASTTEEKNGITIPSEIERVRAAFKF